MYTKVKEMSCRTEKEFMGRGEEKRVKGEVENENTSQCTSMH
jgi:hypothetical protein